MGIAVKSAAKIMVKACFTFLLSILKMKLKNELLSLYIFETIETKRCDIQFTLFYLT